MVQGAILAPTFKVMNMVRDDDDKKINISGVKKGLSNFNKKFMKKFFTVEEHDYLNNSMDVSLKNENMSFDRGTRVDGKYNRRSIMGIPDINLINNAENALLIGEKNNVIKY